MGKLRQLAGPLPVLKPKLAWLGDDKAAASRARDRVHEYRAWYKTQAWRRLRWQVLVRDLFTCQMPGCGKVEPNTSQLVADHKVPHRGDDLLFWDAGNIWCLCKPCHDSAKQKEERSGKPRRFGFSIPDGVRYSAIPVTLVCGPPAAGKTTWIKQRAGHDDLIIDFDVYRARAGGMKWDDDAAVMRQAFAMRDADIRSLATRSGGQAWLIAMAPTKAERLAWGEALGRRLQIVMLATPADECSARVAKDPTRAAAAAKMYDAINQWWRDYDG